MKFLTPVLSLIMLSEIAYGSSSETMKEAEKAPLTIDSSNGLTCEKEKMKCVAEGNVIVRKGPYEMQSHRADAFMKKNKEGKMEINRVEAHNDVKFFGLDGETATADDAVYDIDTQRIDLSPAKGDRVIVWKDDYILLSDKVHIYFKEDEDNKLQVDKIEAKGNVAMSSPDEMVEGHLATFTPENKMILVTGDVRVNRKEGLLRGPAAQVNLDTKTSKMLKETNGNTENRVKVYVYPEEVDKKAVKK